jgi:ABC-type sugar transport system substrate-binding protein
MVTKRRGLIATVALIAVCALTIPALGGASPNRLNSKKTYNIYYSTSFNGNGYRVQSVNTMLALLKGHAPLAGRAKITVVVSPQNTPASQIASIRGIILKHPDAIIIQPSVSAALQPVIQQACNAGIVVGVWDSPVPNKCVYGWFMPIRQIGVLHAEWLAKAMHGHGVLFQDLGLPGVLLAKTIIDGENSVFKKYPGIKKVTFYGNFATGPTVQAVSALLTSHPDVAGVDDMAFINGAFTAFERAHHALVPMSSMPYNAGVVDCATLKGANCGFTYWPAYQAAYVLRTVIDVLDGKKEPHTQLIPTACLTSDGSPIGSLKCGKFTPQLVAEAKAGSPEGASPVSPPWAKPPVTASEIK